MQNMFNNMFGKLGSGMCRLSVNGGIAVKTNDGYKTYNLKNNRLTNCTNFVFDIGEEFFFVIPTNKVEPGDIILVNKKPKCVISVDKDTIKVIDYEDSSIKDILPERHVFMGNTYFYGKIVSMFGNGFTKNKKGMGNIMKYMMFSEMLKGSNNKFNGENNKFNSENNNFNMNPMFMMAMMNGGMNDMFDGMFDFDVEDVDVDEENTNKEEE